MKRFMKSIGVVVLGIGLLGLTSGCGKKLVRGSSGSDQRVAGASIKSLPHEQQTRTASSVAGIDKGSVGQEFDVEGEPRLFEKELDITSSDISGPNIQGDGRHVTDDPFGGSRTAMLTTPASTSASRFDSQYSSSEGSALGSSGRSHGLIHSQVARNGQGRDVRSQRDANRNGVTFSKGLRDIFFQFDSWRLTEEARRNLEANAEWLKAYPHERINIEGHCDERGTQAYNYVLGEKRATMVQQYLGFLGVPQHQLIVTSFGKDKPECHTFSEQCFQKNRRAHFGSDLNVASQH